MRFVGIVAAGLLSGRYYNAGSVSKFNALMEIRFCLQRVRGMCTSSIILIKQGFNVATSVKIFSENVSHSSSSALRGIERVK